jgi:hypothetical protein
MTLDHDSNSKPASARRRRYLIQRLRERFLRAGGAIRERTALTAAETAPDGVTIRCGPPSARRSLQLFLRL